MAKLQEQRTNGQWMTIGSCEDSLATQRLQQEASRRQGRVRAVDDRDRVLDII